MMGVNVDGTCLAAGTVAGEGSLQGGEGTMADADDGENLADIGCLMKFTVGDVLWKLCVMERNWTVLYNTGNKTYDRNQNKQYICYIILLFICTKPTVSIT